ncbi:MAG: hypothetical protein GF364_06625 [Candidatus Lokiarchaeota archaeon]|nr:hypothetical protein [Candidatus Lokiarchaeota archaeon]
MVNIEKVEEINLKNKEKKYDCIIINLNFIISELNDNKLISSNDIYFKSSTELTNKCCDLLRNGGLLFIYGLPKYLPIFGNFLNNNVFSGYYFLFKYWIAIEYSSKHFQNPLPNSHLGLLMYLKTKSVDSPTPFNLNTKTIRVPYTSCPSCGKLTKDWGGKKHLINPLGSALSDVWSYREIQIENANRIPFVIVKRIYDLLDTKKNKFLIVNQSSGNSISQDEKSIRIREKKDIETTYLGKKLNKVFEKDSITFMENLYNDYPGGIFDLVFADPPYNLDKSYIKYKDERSDYQYIEWCNKWLKSMSNVLKPGGALLVLNLPKWAISHSVFLSQFMHFQHWIVWDAMSTPAGKLMPAHYSLLYYTKPGGKPKSNFDKYKYIDSRKYCLRISCVKKRKLMGDDDKELLSDVWKDIHRIKHKKDRDQHPCQLPIKLMERIIKLFSDKGDIIYDPFGGTGTTAIAAKITGRNFIISDKDIYYVRVARNNLKNITTDMFGRNVYNRKSISKGRKNENVSKRLVETSYLDLCFKNKKVLSLEEVKTIDIKLYSLIKNYSGNFKKLKSICKRKLETNSLLK